MTGHPEEKYRSRDFLAGVRRGAYGYWAAAAALVLVWVMLILAAPVAAAMGYGAADSIYGFFSYICHQLPERSFFLLGHKFGVCSRCFGVYFGLLVGVLGYPLLRPMDTSDPLPRFWLFASMVPIAVDWSLGYFNIWANTFFTRVTTGLILGIACAVFILPALIEIAEIRLNRQLAHAKKAA